MHESDKIQQILETQQKILGQVENIRLQQEIFESRFKSELGKDGTLDRIHARYDAKFKEFYDLIYNPETGYAFEIDRMKQRVKRQEERRKEMWALWVAVILMALKIIVDELTKK